MREFLKWMGISVARVASKNSWWSHGYLWCLTKINRVTGFRYQQFLINSIRHEEWPESVFQWPRSVRLLGIDGDAVYLYPHRGEEDFRVVLGGVFEYEPEVFAVLAEILGKHDCVFEIGANVGVFSIWMEQRLRTCRKLRGFFCFEPSSNACSRLLRNAAANHCRRLSLLNVAISDRSGSVSFFEPEGHLTNGSLSREFAGLFSGVIHETVVSTMTMEALADIIPCGANVLLKIDVEGHEVNVLGGCAVLFRSANVDLIIEVLDGFEAEVFSKLGSLCDFEKISRLGARDWFLRCRPKCLTR